LIDYTIAYTKQKQIFDKMQIVERIFFMVDNLRDFTDNASVSMQMFENVMSED